MIAADMVEIMTKLLSCDHPFQWQPEVVLEIVPNDMVHRLTGQLNEKIFEDDFYFELLMLYVGLSYEYAKSGRVKEAMKTLETGENKLNAFIQSFPANMNQAAQHILSATKARMLVQQGNLGDAVKILSDIPSVDSMSTENRAALFGFRAVFFDEYGISGTKRALEFATKAIDLSPDEPMWYFLKGKYLGRLRRVERPYDIPDADEIELLKKASSVRVNSSFIIFAAQMYCETASRIYRMHLVSQSLYPSTKLLVDKLNRESLNLYKCAKGFIKLLALMSDDKNLKQRTKALLDEGLKVAPENGYGNHVMAQYYERVKKEKMKAIKYLRVCEKQRIFGAVMDLIRLEYRSGQRMDFVQRLMDLLSIYEETSRKCQVYSQMISYQVFVLGDLQEACRNTYTIMNLDPKSDNMLRHRAICLREYRRTVNLYEVLIDEIKIRLQDKIPSEDQIKYYHKFLNDLSFTGQPVSICKPQYLKNEILETRVVRPYYERRRTLVVSSEQSPQQRRNKNTEISHHIRLMADGFITYHKTDVDQNTNEIFNRCVEALEKDKENKYKASRQTGPSEDRQSVPTLFEEEHDDSESRIDLDASVDAVYSSGEGSSSVGRSAKSDTSDYDEDAFRMIIHKKVKENSNRVCCSSETIVSPLEKLRILDS